jgi:predicted deacetylase
MKKYCKDNRMAHYIIRLDDACSNYDLKKWARMEELMDKYHIRPLVGVIPCCKDPMLIGYPYDPKFWDRVSKWVEKGWQVAMHGYDHVCTVKAGGSINPVNMRSEFATLPLETQEIKVKEGIAIMRSNGLEPNVFFAPSHTFDENTLLALAKHTHIHVISDTIANDVYSRYGFTFVPQQCGNARKLPLKLVTFCYHPNSMNDNSFRRLEKFLYRQKDRFIDFPAIKSVRKKDLYDRLLCALYFSSRRLKLALQG